MQILTTEAFVARGWQAQPYGKEVDAIANPQAKSAEHSVSVGKYEAVAICLSLLAGPRVSDPFSEEDWYLTENHLPQRWIANLPTFQAVKSTQLSASCFEIRAGRGAIRLCMPDYVIGLDPVHRVLRITIRKVVTDQVVLDVYRSCKAASNSGGPYAALAIARK